MPREADPPWHLRRCGISLVKEKETLAVKSWFKTRAAPDDGSRGFAKGLGNLEKFAGTSLPVGRLVRGCLAFFFSPPPYLYACSDPSLVAG